MDTQVDFSSRDRVGIKVVTEICAVILIVMAIIVAYIMYTKYSYAVVVRAIKSSDSVATSATYIMAGLLPFIVAIFGAINVLMCMRAFGYLGASPLYASMTDHEVSAELTYL